MQAPQENNHNGGLIDFHESALRADLGSALYSQALAGQSMYQTNGAGLCHPVQAGLGVQAGFPQVGLGQPAYAQPAYAQPAYAQPAYAQPGYAPAMAMTQAPAQCIAGPPAFVHLHGQVYRPVEEAAAGAPPVPESVAPRAGREPAKPQSVKSIERMVEKRVEQRVEEFLAKTSKDKAASRNTGKKNKDALFQQESLRSLNQKMRQRL